ncbi:MAG: hypothetical protein M1818_006980 [Claussenomyces sp. TS43310]|nr:MAG: hypothetical protein M1818_006980 [Claussenomyces sp. TS43310]
MAPTMFTYTTHSISTGPEGSDNPLFSLEGHWSSSTSSTDGRTRTNPTSTHTSPISIEVSSDPAASAASNGACFDSSLVWSGEGLGRSFGDHIHPTIPRSKSMNAIPQQATSPITPWYEGQQDPSALLSNATGLQQQNGQAFGVERLNAGFDKPSRLSSGSCNCFTTCLQALQALHNHSGPSQAIPPFDVVLTINRKAVQGCAMMLNCSQCLSKSGSNTTAMLLATIISQIMSFYRAASQSYFGITLGPISPTHSLPLTFGTYRINGEESRWLEMEILWRELRRLEELFGRFQDICGRGPGGLDMGSVVDGDEVGVRAALMNYLGQSLQCTFDMLKMQEATLVA